jgi:hypothetical protein
MSAERLALAANLDDYNKVIVPLTRVMAERINTLPPSAEKSRAKWAFNVMTSAFNFTGPEMRRIYEGLPESQDFNLETVVTTHLVATIGLKGNIKLE